MEPKDIALIEKLEETLKTISKKQGELLAKKIRPLLYNNLSRKRIHQFIEGNNERVPEYVYRVINCYKQQGEYVHKIQIDRSNMLWEELIEKLRLWAYHYFVSKNFSPGKGTLDLARENATEAAIVIINAYFPFDVEFNPWARVILIHTCQKYIRSATKKSIIPSKKLVNLDAISFSVSDLNSTSRKHHEEKMDLMDAINKLQETRQQIIRMLYFEGVSPKEIAERMDKSIGAIYSLHFNALKDMKKILDQNGDKDE